MLRAPRRRLAGAERGLRGSQGLVNHSCFRVRAAENAPRGRSDLLERRHGIAEIVERGAGVIAERRRVKRLHGEREIVTLSQNASRHGYRIAHKCLGFFEALQIQKQ